MSVHHTRCPRTSHSTPSPSVLPTATISMSSEVVAAFMNFPAREPRVESRQPCEIKCHTKGTGNGQAVAARAPQTRWIRHRDCLGGVPQSRLVCRCRAARAEARCLRRCDAARGPNARAIPGAARHSARHGRGRAVEAVSSGVGSAVLERVRDRAPIARGAFLNFILLRLARNERRTGFVIVALAAQAVLERGGVDRPGTDRITTNPA